MGLAQFRMPDLGEGLTEAEVVRWLVRPGDEVRLNQPLVEVETAKAAVEVPSPYAGVVQQLHADAGATVDVGSVIVTVRTGGPDGGGRDGSGAESAPPDDQPATLVGYGPRPAVARRRRPTGAAPSIDRAAAPSAPGAPAPPVAPPLTGPGAPPPATAARVSAAAVGQRAAQVAGGVPVLAKPPVRKLARDLGVDLTSVLGTGPHGSISRADVEAAAAPPPRLAEDGVRRVPVRGVRRATAAAMVRSAFTAPHVTEFLTVDVTATLELRDRLAARPDAAGVRLSPLVFTARALLLALRRTPEMNSSWDDDAGEIVVFERVHLGIAAATPRGLLVPNVKDAQRLDLLGLARALTALTEQARSGRTPPADLTDGTITITNVGALGVDTGTPILNPGEAAVLCLGAVRPMPWVHEGQLAVRQVVQLAVSFDHRVVDGHEASRFLADVGAVLHDPALALAWC